MKWVRGPNGTTFCTDHPGQEWKTDGAKTCQECPGPLRLNRRSETGASIDPFPELTTAFAPMTAELRDFESHCKEQEESLKSTAPTAAAAYGRLRLSAMTARHGYAEKLAEHRRVAALEERRAWSARMDRRGDSAEAN